MKSHWHRYVAFPKSVFPHVDAYADANDCSHADAVRQLVYRGLGLEFEPSWDDPGPRVSLPVAARLAEKVRGLK